MNRRRILLASMGGAFVSAGLLGLACSSTDTPAQSLPTAPAVDASPKPDAATADTGAPVDTQDAGADCGKAPTLHPPSGDGGVYCPFSAVDGGKNLYCTQTQQCCETPKDGPPSTCVTRGTACPTAGSTVWECEDPSDCPGSGMKCCAHGSGGTAVTVGEDTCGPYLSKFDGTRCAASCDATELVVCEKQSQCATGTCTAVEPKANQIGICH